MPNIHFFWWPISDVCIYTIHLAKQPKVDVLTWKNLGGKGSKDSMICNGGRWNDKTSFWKLWDFSTTPLDWAFFHHFDIEKSHVITVGVHLSWCHSSPLLFQLHTTHIDRNIWSIHLRIWFITDLFPHMNGVWNCSESLCFFHVSIFVDYIWSVLHGRKKIRIGSLELCSLVNAA